jgi:FkbM family methyltransferase
MHILIRILESVRDGSFAIKVLNRFSRIKYVPSENSILAQYIPEQYPGDGWKSLSPNARTAWVELFPVFQQKEVHTIAYVGANNGEGAIALDEAFPGKVFYLLEPVPETFETLVKNVAAHPNFHCLNIAAGADEQQLDMYVDSFSPASSLLPYEDLASEEFPFLQTKETLKAEVQPLDSILRECGAGRIDLLLMDVQGYEDEVLRGANQTLKSCKVVISELSLEHLYVGSSTFDSVYQTLVDKGFHLKCLMNPMKGKSHRILQIDGVFLRE